MGGLMQSHSLWVASKIPRTEEKFTPGEGHISSGVKNRYNIVIEMRRFLGS